MSNIIHVIPTGNADSDVANIESARDKLTSTKLGKGPGCIILSGGGDYRINKTLVFGELGDRSDPYGPNVNPPTLVGAGVANLTWDGGESADASKPVMIEYINPWYSPGAYIQNLCLWCKGQCRGMRVFHATSPSKLSGILIRTSTQVGLDLIDCWASATENIHVRNATGIGIRTSSHNSVTMIDTRIHADGSDASYYPPVDEEQCYNYNGDWVQTADDERAGLVWSGGTSFIANLLMEGGTYNSYPAITFLSGRLHVTTVRFESTETDNELVKIKDATDITIQNTSWAPTTNAVVRAKGTCRNILLDQIWGVASKGVLVCDGGEHYGHEVRRVRDHDESIGLAQWIVEENNPTMSGKICADSDHSVSIPWQ